MIIPKKSRAEIYEYLFREGVIVAKKDYNAPKHTHIETVPNLYVIKAMQSMKSRGYVHEQFCWQWYYWSLTTEGVVYLRDYLHLPAEIVPATLKKKPMPVRGPTRDAREGDRSGFRRNDDREGYRPRRFDGEKKAGAGAGGDFKPEFRGGFGRGRRDQA
eukprot:Lithocolla_globosa_v1_NODE_6390_length_1094_cov_6741.760346.p1 type:complete len:159 gc:universal NODE_6390_length_1094_cov_6741.760346:556-80(-)